MTHTNFRFFVVFFLQLVNSLSAATFEVAQLNPQAADDGPGTTERPFKTIAAAAERVQAGDVVRVRGGIYRERVVVETDGTASEPIRFEAAEREHVVITGADRVTGWRKSDESRPIYRAEWPHRFIEWNATMTHPNDEHHRVIGRCEQVIINGYLLRQVLSNEQLAPGTFFADITNKTLSVWDTANRDLNKCFVEASVRQELFHVEGDHVQVRGLKFRYAANMAQRAAVILAGKSNLMEDCVVEQMNSSGALFRGEEVIVRRCVFRENGQLGFSANRAHRLLFTDCLVENNNTKNFDRGWEAGGNKLVFCRDAVLEQSRFVRNRGNGVWFDIGNTNCVVRNCLIAENDDAGIFYEISYALRAHDNVIIGNGFATTPGAWGAQAGISLSSSPGCVVERNILVGNREGFNFREQMRTTPTIEERTEQPIWNHDQLIRNNVIAYNRDAQIWGWFDVKDSRHWPAKESDVAMREPDETPKTGDIAERFTAKTTNGQPQSLSLEKLNIQFEGNVYDANPGQGWFNWGTTWSRHQKYATLREFQSALQIDRNSRSSSVPFADVLRMDFRLPANAAARLKSAYPKGTIPGVILAAP